MNNLILKESITFNSANQNAVDINLPLPFLDWMQYFVNITSDPTQLLKSYKQYIVQWFQVNKAHQQSQQNIIKSLYVSLYQTISLNYLTQEEKRFISTVDVSNSQNQQIILPLLVNKLKQVCLYYVQLRESIKQSTIQHNLKSSPFSINKIVQDEIVNSFLDPELNQLLISAGITLENIQSQVQIDVENLYDAETNYFDISDTLPTSAYQSDTFNVINSSYDFDPDLFVNFDQSVVKEILSEPFITPEFGNNFSVSLPVSASDLQYLDTSNFIDYVNTDNSSDLNLNTLRQTLRTYSGTDFYYLSTDSNSNFTFGVLFNSNKFANYLNRRFPTTVASESNNLKSETEVGLFFTPSKQGILNFLTFNLQGTLVSDLSANYIYVFPDPNIYGNISGLSQTKFNTPFIFAESVNILKDSTTNSNSFGRVLSDYLTKFKAYQSRSETLHQDIDGSSRLQDSIEFFTTPLKNIWANQDAFPLEQNGSFPIKKRQQSLLVRNNKVAVTVKSDIFNNQFILFKEIYQAVNPSNYIQDNNQIIALTLDNHTFYDSVSGYSFDYDIVDSTLGYSGVTLTCPPLSSTVFDYFLPAGKFLTQQDYFKPAPTVIGFIDCGGFVNAGTSTTVYDLSTFKSVIHNNIADGGRFIINGTDAQPFIQSANYSINNNFINAPGSITRLCSATGTLSADIPLFRQPFIPGELVFRNYNNTLTSSASSVLSALYTKYSSISGIQDELNNNLLSVDIILDNIILETSNFIIFEKLNYDLTSNVYTRVIFNQNLIYKQETNVYTNIWYNEQTFDILIGELVYNNRQINLNLYKQNTTINCIFSSMFFDQNVSVLSSVYISNIDPPKLTYNVSNDTYLISFLIKDTSSYFFPVNYQFKLDKQYNIYNENVSIMTSNMSVYSESFLGASVQFNTTLVTAFSSSSSDYTLQNGVLLINNI